jgi:radical SAM-linked protein
MNDDACHDASAARPDAFAPGRATAAIRFRVEGLPRFLSHAETQRVLERACVRAAVPLRYSAGFNPHPKLSLPLPRPVGVQSDDELLVARLVSGGASFEDRPAWEAATQQALDRQLPNGIIVWAVVLAGASASFHPQSAEYVLPLRATDDPERIERLRDRSAGVMARDTYLVDRSVPESPRTWQVDVRPFLAEIRLEGDDLIVRHEISTAGSIRVEEIMQLFGLQTQDLAGPVRRTNVTWGTGS